MSTENNLLKNMTLKSIILAQLPMLVLVAIILIASFSVLYQWSWFRQLHDTYGLVLSIGLSILLIVLSYLPRLLISFKENNSKKQQKRSVNIDNDRQ